jgi:F-type H+-transporting ATPase subunit epsilon
MAIPHHLTLRIVTPERAVIEEQVDEVEVPGAEGYFGVLPGHTPMLASLSVGELWFRKGQERTYLFVSGGFAEVQPDAVTILASEAERAAEIDVARAQAARDQADARLSRPTVDLDVDAARLSLQKAVVRLQVASRARVRA